MKTSNKILLGGFITIVLMIAAVHIALYAKYKKGDYTIYNPADYIEMQSFQGIKYVTIRNIMGARMTFSDTARVEKEELSGITYAQKGDSLIIDGVEYYNNRPDINISIPHDVNLFLSNSSVSFGAGNYSESNPVIHLKRSFLFMTPEKGELRLGNLKIIATDSSSATFLRNNQVAKLDVELSQSAIEYMDGNFGELNILTDSISRISLPLKHLVRANIKSNTQ